MKSICIDSEAPNSLEVLILEYERADKEKFIYDKPVVVAFIDHSYTTCDTYGIPGLNLLPWGSEFFFAAAE